jgi:hypothetical protein
MTNQEAADASLLKINDAMHHLLSKGKKITQSRVSQLSGLSVCTVQRHWYEFDIPEIPGIDDVTSEQVFVQFEELNVNELFDYSQQRFEIKAVRKDAPPKSTRIPKYA